MSLATESTSIVSRDRANEDQVGLSASEPSRRQLAPSFRWASLWEAPVINPINGKSYTFPLLRLDNQYSINFHLAWLGFFVAFLSWFAFPPLIPEAIKNDLHLTTPQIGNSNIVALCATLAVRFAIGPFVDRFGPRLTMAGLLIVGAIPSGLAGTAHNASTLYTLRFFIGILGGTFVPCQAWTTAFYDKNVVGTANAFAGGWGNLGGGVTFVVQVGLYQALLKDGLTPHSAWRACFAIVPVPLLLCTAAAILFFGTDCPAGKWNKRHTLPATIIAQRHGHIAELDADERQIIESKLAEKEQGDSKVVSVDSDEPMADIDVAVAEHLTFKKAAIILTSPYTLLPALMYMTTFGFELAVDSNLANVFYASQGSNPKTFGQLKAGYYASLFGFLNLFTRPAGGLLGDLVYKRYGTKGKKYLTVVFGFLQGAMSLAYGLWLRGLYKRNASAHPSIGIQMALVALMAIFCEAANGSNFSLVPHCNAYSNGFMTGIVGSMGNLGGIFFAIIFRYHTTHSYASAWWISGVFAMGVNLICSAIPVPKL